MFKDPLEPQGLKVRVLGIALKRLPFLRYVLLRRAYLKESGWVASAHANTPVSRDGAPLAWYTYSALDFLSGRIGTEMDVFEFGAGHSTLWWAARTRSVLSVENDEGWVANLAPRLPGNAAVRHVPLDEDGMYARSAVSSGSLYDVIVIDGYDRNHCGMRSVEALKSDGVIVWDNSDWHWLFGEGMAFLEGHGFRRIDFTGLAPLNGYGCQTSVFYRPGENCMGI